MSSFKRLRSVHDGIEDDSPSPSPTPSPTLKAARTSATPPPGAGEPSTSSGHILCTLPPTCNPPNRPTHLAGTRDLEAHYAMYHAHVCEEKGCGCVFPDARLLELHQTECHDPLAAVRKERGEKIFACHLATCPRRFSTPKTRRLHLIEAHGYPKEYFFAVTNKGVGGLLKRWGEGASLLRRPWRPRENAHPDGDEDQDETEAEMEAEPTAVHEPEEDSDDDEQILFEKMPVDRPAAKPIISNGRTEAADKAPMKSNGKAKATQPGEDADALANAMGSLSLVPTSIQFGRGAKRGARGHAAPSQRQGHLRQRSTGEGERGAPMDLEQHGVPGRGRGRHRGRGGPHMGPRGAAMRGNMSGRGAQRGTMLGPGVGRGIGPGRGVRKESAQV